MRQLEEKCVKQTVSSMQGEQKDIWALKTHTDL